MKRAPLFAAFALLALAAVPAGGQEGQSTEAAKPADPQPAAPSIKALTGAEVPSYFVITAFLRRAALVLDRPANQRPAFFATFGCSEGATSFEACSKLIREAAAIHARELDDSTPTANQAGLDAKGRDMAVVYARLLKLLGPQAANFHQKVEEVRLTVGIGLSDNPGYDLLQAARLFDRDLASLYPELASLPGFVAAPSPPPSPLPAAPPG